MSDSNANLTTKHDSVASSPTNVGPNGVPSPAMSDFTQKFLLEEFDHRRQEIVDYLARKEADQRNGLILTGAIWSWLAANQSALAGQGYFEKVVIFLPTVLMSFFFYRWYQLRKPVRVNRNYIRNLEDKAGVTTIGLGYQTQLDNKREKDPAAASIAPASRKFWVGLIVTNLFLAFVYAASRGWFAR